MSNRATSHQALALMTVGLNQLAVGIVDGWLTLVLNINQDPLRSWVIWLGITGRIFGATMAGVLLDKIGRKFLLSICAITFCLPWLAIPFANSEFISLYFASAAFGIACGINEVSNSAYLGENSSPSNRGIFGTINISTTYFLGCLIGFIPGAYFDHRIAAIINFCITLLSFISVFWMIEPVQYLLIKGRHDQARKNHAWLKGVADSEEETPGFEKIKQNVYAETSKKSSCGKIFTSPANYKSLFIVLTIYSLAGMAGYQRASPFFSYHFENPEARISSIFTIFYGCTQFLIAALSPFIIGRFKRRSVILISFSLVSLAHALMAVLFLIDGLVVLSHYLLSIFFRISVMFSACAYAFSYPTLFILRSELFPLSMKGIGSSMSIIVHAAMIYLMEWIIGFVGFNEYFSFTLFSVITAVLVLFVYFKVPETGNKSLIDIQKNFDR